MGKFYTRKYLIGASIIIVAITFILQLAYLQLIDKSYKQKGLRISHNEVIQNAPRGLIFDRNGTLLVNNTSVFTLSVIPRIAKANGFDTIFLAKLLEIPIEELRQKLEKAKKESQYYYKYAKVQSNLSPSVYANIKEHLFKFPGFDILNTEGRKYNYPSLSHTIGYIKEIDDAGLENDSYYKMGDYVGKSGIEKTFEKELRGVKGATYYLQDHKQKIVGRYNDGLSDIPTVAGHNLTLSIDIELQEYANKLMQNKRGAIIAISPKTGEILAKVSAPNYNLDSLYGAGGGQYYTRLNADKENKPLFDRTLLAQYPPGSIFKLVNALIGLEEGIITPSYHKSCNGGAYIGNFFMKCHNHSSPVYLKNSIQNSCNPFYAQFFNDMLNSTKYNSVQDAYQIWYDYVKSFGLGQKLGDDFPIQVKGNVPDIAYYNKRLKRKNWKALNIISVSIGQGELLISPLQMANMITTIANKGYYYPPHIVKKISGKPEYENSFKRYETGIKSKYFEEVIEGMVAVTEAGTGQGAKVENITVAGKTGTVQVPGGQEDHSVFVAFAPVENPQISLIVYVENGVWGGRYAAPIAGLLIEKYLNDTIAPSKKWIEKSMIEANLIKSTKKYENVPNQ